MSPSAPGAVDTAHLCSPAPLALWGPDRVPELGAETPARAAAGRAGCVIQDPRRREGEKLFQTFFPVEARPSAAGEDSGPGPGWPTPQGSGPEHLSPPHPHSGHLIFRPNTPNLNLSYQTPPEGNSATDFDVPEEASPQLPFPSFLSIS